jgi:hypothetical protein
LNKRLTNISPALVQSDSQLQYYLIRKLRQKNMRKTLQPWFKLRRGTRVWCYNDVDKMDKRRSQVIPEQFEVQATQGGKYQLKGIKSGRLILLPRFKIMPVNKTLSSMM